MSHQLFGYITVTCHFIDDEWNLKSSVLATVNMMKDHTAENIASDLKTITDEWNITGEEFAVLTNNASTIVAVNITVEKDQIL